MNFLIYARANRSVQGKLELVALFFLRFRLSSPFFALIYPLIHPKFRLQSPFPLATQNCWRMNTNPSGSWTHNGATDALEITLSQDALLHGFLLWGVRSGSGSHDVTIRVKDNQGQTLAMKKGSYRTVSSQKTFVVKFPQPVKLKNGVRYTISALLKGKTAHKGKGGRNSITCNDVTVTFVKSSSSSNSSSASSGQIPALILSKSRACE